MSLPCDGLEMARHKYRVTSLMFGSSSAPDFTHDPRPDHHRPSFDSTTSIFKLGHQINNMGADFIVRLAHRRRVSASSGRSVARRSSSTYSTASSLSDEVMDMTLPLAPREDDYNMSDSARRAQLLARCRLFREPWKSARPLVVEEK